MKHQKSLDNAWTSLELGDASAIHEIRKLTRKAGAELRAFGAPKKIQGAWRALRRAIAPLRDWDVVGEQLEQHLEREQVSAELKQATLEDWAAERDQRYAYLVLPAKPHPFEAPKNSEKNTQELLKEVLHDDWSKLKRMAKRILPDNISSAWHDFRKKLKRFRHTLELLHDPPEVLLELLRHLGRIQDADMVISVLKDPKKLSSLDQGAREHWILEEQKTRLERAENVRRTWALLKEIPLEI
jgi:CHAD domain-containing protein